VKTHTPGPWEIDGFYQGAFEVIAPKASVARGRVVICSRGQHKLREREFQANARLIQILREREFQANARLIAAAPDLLAACINARDMLATDRQAFVDCQQLRDARTDDPIAHGLVCVADGVWIEPEVAEPLRDYDRALALIDAATAKATGAAL